ncbi:MAG: iron-containing alcohol dehydrogenase [Bacillota bacterium]
MESFEFYNPVKVIWGPGKFEKLGEKAAEYGKKALIVTTGLKRTNIIPTAREILENQGIEVHVLDEVEPNPKLSTVKKGEKICREQGIDIVLAIGGGSSIDCAKTIAVAAENEGDVWDFFLLERTAERALPIGVVSTTAATGSEMNVNAVLTNEETGQKYAIHYEFIFPRFSIVDPELHVTIPPSHTAYGAYDTVSHVLESYFDGIPETPVQDYLSEGIIKTTVDYAPKAVENPEDIVARGNLSWASIMALNGTTDAGRGDRPYDAHTIEHEISAKYDIPHGAGLAIVQPQWLKHKARKDPEKFVQFAERVFNIDTSGKSDLDVALEGIEALKDWAGSIGNPLTLKEVGVEKERLEEIAEDITKNPEGQNLDKDEVYRVLVESYEQ